MDRLWLDLRYALRTLRREPGFAAVAVLSLALAIAANTTVFSIVNWLLLRPLAVLDPEGLVSVYRERGEQRWVSLSYPEYRDLQERSRSFSELTAFTVPGLEASLRLPGRTAETTPIALVTGNHFRTLGLEPLRGRFFTEAGDGTGGELPVVLSERVWRTRFDADESLLGREVVVNGQSGFVVGIMPEAFTGTFTALRTDVWVPLSAQPLVLRGPDSIERRDAAFLNVIGRVRAGVRRELVEADLRRVAQDLASAQLATDRAGGFTVTSTSGVPPFIGQFLGGFLALLLGVVGVVLIVACSNLAGLLLARATARGRELTVRAALGATRSRVLSQLLVESLLLAVAAAVLGLLLTKLALSALVGFVPNLGLPVDFDVSLDVRVLQFTILLTAGATVLFGLLPALRASRPQLATALREATGLPARLHVRLRGAVLVAQVALSVLLLSGTVLLLRGLRNASEVDIGFNPDGVALLSFDLTMLGYNAERRAQLYTALQQRARALPGVEAVAIAQMAPLGPRGDQTPLVARPGGDTLRVGYNTITPGFLELLRIPLVQGRNLTEADSRSAVVGEQLARTVWPAGSALGQRFTVRGHQFEVVGIARDIKYSTIGEAPRPFVYFPLGRASDVRGGPADVVLHVRARGNPAPLTALLRRELSALDPDVPASTSLMANGIAFSLFPARLAGRIVGACGLLAVVLVIVGLHALAAYTVAQRTRELGIRMAMGAAPADIARLVAGQSVVLTVIGLVLGLPLALLFARLLRALLYGVPPTDPATYAAVTMLLGLAVLIATAVPVRRAIRADPLAALRAW